MVLQDCQASGNPATGVIYGGCQACEQSFVIVLIRDFHIRLSGCPVIGTEQLAANHTRNTGEDFTTIFTDNFGRL